MKPIYIQVKDINKEEIEKIIENIFNFYEKISSKNIKRKYVGNYWNNGDFGSLEWYILKSLDGSRVNANTFFELLNREPWQKQEPHYDLVIIDNPLYDGHPENNFIFGYTEMVFDKEGNKMNNNGKVLISTHHIKKFYRENWKIALQGILLHELGHLFGLPNLKNPHYISIPRTEYDLRVGHCNRKDCIMEQINVPGCMDLLEKTKYLIENNRKMYCKYDLESLIENLKKL